MPVSEIEALLKPLLHEAEGDIDDLNYDRIVLLLSNLIDRYFIIMTLLIKLIIYLLLLLL